MGLLSIKMRDWAQLAAVSVWARHRHQQQERSRGMRLEQSIMSVWSDEKRKNEAQEAPISYSVNKKNLTLTFDIGS